MLTELSVQNFKCWKSIEKMRLGKITGLFGKNSSGKTSILQMLLLLKQTVESPDRGLVLFFGDERSPVSLGSFDAIAYGHGDSSLRFDISWQLLKPRTFAHPPLKDQSSQHISFTTVIDKNKSSLLSVKEMVYDFGPHKVQVMRKDNAGKSYDLQSPTGLPLPRNQGRAWPLGPPLKCYGFPERAQYYYKNVSFLQDLVFEFEELFRGVFYLGPLRDQPRRDYPWTGAQPAEVGRRGERAVGAILAADKAGVKISRGRGHPRLAFRSYLKSLMKKMGLLEDFDIKQIIGTDMYQVLVRESGGSTEVLLTDVGFGISQVLPIIVLSYYVPEHSIVLLEQPELHLHPSAQMNLADVLIDAMRKRHVQFIIESHSEHLLMRLQRRIAEGGLPPDNVALYFCQPGSEGSKPHPLEVDLFGNIANWPKDFFGDDFGERSQTVMAGIRRREAASE